MPHQSCLTASTDPSRTIPTLSTASPLRHMHSPGEYLNLLAPMHLHMAAISSSVVPRNRPEFLRMGVGFLMVSL